MRRLKQTRYMDFTGRAEEAGSPGQSVQPKGVGNA